MDTPKFNFGAVRKRWRNDLLRAESKVQRLAAKVDRLNANLEADEDELNAAWEAFEEAQANRDQIASIVIESVPAGWLVDDAPEALDWDEPGAIEWIRADCYQSLMTALTEAMQNPAGK